MDVVLVTIDALRYDCIGNLPDSGFLERYGMEDELSTPTMDSIAKNGVTFTQAVSTAPETPMAHASLFTGMYPPKHGIRSFFHRKLSKNSRTIFEIFDANDFKTIGVGDKVVFHDALELSRGCEHFIDHDKGDQKVFETINKIKSDSNDLFLFHRFLDVHFPYLVCKSPPSEGYLEESFHQAKRICDRFDYEFILKPENMDKIISHVRQWNDIREYLDGKQTVDEVLLPLYIKGVSKFDKGRFENYLANLRELGVLEDEYLLVITSDHGEGVIRSEKTEDTTRRFDHSYANLDELVRIPLVFTSPSLLPQSKNIETQVSIVDILPTIVDLLDLSLRDRGDGPQGKSLAKVINGQTNSGSIGYSEYALWNDGRFDDSNIFKDMFSSNGEVLEYDALFRRRSIRTPRYRYVELGQELSNESLPKDPENFVRELFRRVRAKWPKKHPNEIEEMTSLIVNEQVTRDDLIDEILSEAILDNRYALYDLRTDPQEHVNLLLTDFEQYETEASKFKDQMAKVVNQTVNDMNDSVCSDEGIGESVHKNLEDLGYL